MENITLIDPTQDPRWDQFVENHSFGWICHLSGWKRVLESSFKHMKGHYFALVGEDNRIKAGLPIYEVKSWLTGNRLVSIPFATLCDPLISKSEDLNELLQAAIKLSEKSKSSFIEIRTLSSGSLIQNEKLAKISNYKHHFLLLNEDPDHLKSKFHRTCVRQRISRAIESNLKMRIGDKKSDLHMFYNLHLISRRRLSLPPQPFRFYESLWEVFLPAKQLTLLVAEADGKDIAAIILLKYKDRVSAEFAVSDESYKNMSPNHFLFWEAIKMSYDEGYKVFDFGRTSPSNKSLMDFKKRWATKMIDLPQYYYPEKIAIDSVERENSMGYKLVSAICSRAPDSVLKIIGNISYRHLG